MGSLVDDKKLRFDFSHIAPLTETELHEVESLVNAAILDDLVVETKEMSRTEAEQTGAMALFEEKYGDVVRVVSMGLPGSQPVSLELCGGTHLQHTAQAGVFLITSESGVAAGTRRIEAVTGEAALQLICQQRSYLQQAQALLKANPDQVSLRISALQKELKTLRKASEQNVGVDPKALLDRIEDVSGIRLLCTEVPSMSMKSLRSLMDGLRGSLTQGGVICLASVEAEKVNLLLYVAKDLQGRFSAVNLIRPVAQEIGGSGGGRPDLAQAGGSKPACLAQAFATLKKLLA